jgi:hypothetical protein
MNIEQLKEQIELKKLQLKNLEAQNDEEEKQIKLDIENISEEIRLEGIRLVEERKQKIEQFKELYSSIGDVYYASNKLAEGYSNPALYLKEAIDSMDNTKLLQLYNAWKEDEVLFEEKKKQEKVDAVLNKIDISALTEEQKQNKYVQSYIQKQNELLAELDNLIK